MKFFLVLLFVAVAAVSADDYARLLKFEDVRDENVYHNEFELDDGTHVKEEGHLVEGAEGPVYAKSGSFSYIGKDGMHYEIFWTADANGFQATGAHLPVPPS